MFRQNAGCTELIVGRDHAGVGDYYGGFDAQTIFDERVPEGALEIDIYRADHTAYSKKLDRVVMMKDAPDHSKEDFVCSQEPPYGKCWGRVLRHLRSSLVLKSLKS